ncbi:MAG TPA: isochorismatase family cysteine hydrolase [Pyrinomonadaceae bacterium]|nr:isochorismatase family cysteine hydrolase [Pyrinomonadaceae bacterium]
MPRESHDLHGSAPDKSETVLLLIDVINDFDFPEGDQLLQLAQPVGKNIAGLTKRVKAAGIPCIYVNDNFGKWQSDFKKIVEHCTADDAKGKDFVKQLVPGDDDYFVLKPKHSGFYSTTLSLLLTHLTAKNLLLTGIAGNNCVLVTANDAYMRDFKLFVPADCVVSNTEEENQHALTQMQKVLKADISKSTDLDLQKIG